MKQLLLCFLVLFFFSPKKAFASGKRDACFYGNAPADTTLMDSVLFVANANSNRIPHPKKENKKLVAAVLAFPIPFGFIGLHRIYLGTEPWVPVVYLCTLGGGMILPLADFIAILATKNEEELKQFENNPKLFMWIP